MREALTRPFRSTLIWPALALLAIFGFNFFFLPGFFHFDIRDGHLIGSVVDILDRGSPLLLVAIGMTLVIATGGVDLSVGAVMAIAGAVAASLAARDASLATILVVSLAVSAIAGAWNGVLVAFFRVQPIVATLILMVAGRGVAQLLTAGQIVTFDHGTFNLIGGGYALGLPVPVLISLTAFIFAGLFTRASAAGLFIEAVGNNATASRLAGVHSSGIRLLAYTISGLTAGMAGLIVCADIRGADANNAGLYLELDGILAVVIGGTALTGGRFSLAGAALGAIIIQTLTTSILTFGIPVEWTLVTKALVVLAICLIQSREFRATLRMGGRVT